MHPTLLRQIKRFLGENVDISTFPKPWQDFMNAVSETYTHSDSDHALIERSLEISSKELTESNQKLRTEIENARHQAEQAERINNLMVGRELKMIELKKENEALKNQIYPKTNST